MDTMKITKLVGALCVAGLAFLFGKWGAETIFHRGAPAEVHGAADDGHGAGTDQAYAVDTGADDDHGEGAAGPDPMLVALAAADAAKGEKIFKKCQACHSLEAGKNGTGPSLAGIFGQAAGAVGGFGYSDAMAGSGLTWDAETLYAFLGNVKGTVPGTKMSFAGLKKEQDRADVIAYIAGGAFVAPEAPAAESHAEEADHSEDAPAASAALVGDAANGENVFKKCKACHSVEAGKNGTGPSLAGIVDRAAGSVEGFKYSRGMDEFAAAGATWDAATLDAYLADVKGTVPGTKMSFAGLKKDQDRADLIAYLATQ